MTDNIIPMTEDLARVIYNWHYEEPFSIYDLLCEDGDYSELLNQEYFAYTKGNRLVGFYCFGESARVPSGNAAHVYDDETYFDFGLGMNPELTGKGKGYEFCETGLKFFENKFNVKKFRLTVLVFNLRAIKLYQKLGFNVNGYFAGTENRFFLVMTLDRS